MQRAMRNWTLSVATLAASLTASTIAFAQPAARTPQPVGSNTGPADAPAAPSPPPAPPNHAPAWYGYQTFAVDLVSALLVAGGVGMNVATNANALGGVVGGAGAFGYLFGGPIVHLVHHRAGAAGKDFLLRFLGPGPLTVVGYIVGTVIGGQYSCGTGDGPSLANCGSVVGTEIGATVGLAAVVTIDALVLAREPQSIPSEPSASRGSDFSLVPVAAFTRDKTGSARPMLGLGATF